MIRGDFVYALTVGMVVTLNPCGFAMLPAYLSSFIGLTGPAGQHQPASTGVRRAILVSLSVSLGFVSVFLALGLLVRAGAEQIYDASKWLTLIVGIVLAVLGAAVIGGYKLPVFLPRLEKGGRDRTFGSMFVFGVSYAVASLGCSLGFFLSVVFTTARNHGIVSGIATFLMYGLGFTLVLTGLTVSLALAQGGLLRVLRSALRWIDRLAGFFLLSAGLYLAWYGLAEIRGSSDSIVTRGTTWSGRLTTWIDSIGAVPLAVIFGSVILGGAGWVAATRRHRAQG